MKNKSFASIIFISLIIFVALLFSVYKFILKDETKFYADGYVSITDSEVSEKVYFKSGTSYKKGYNEDIIFKSKDKVKENISKYSFVYYDNQSISYLSDGVLMDLDKVNSSFIPYYNIKSNYIIEYENNEYKIKSTENDIVLNNFIGRISDTKYLVAGSNLKLKLSGSDEMQTAYYFELNFKDGNIVKIDNKEINLETISDECYILVGDHIKIDLSKKIITYDEELKANLSEIIINNDSNIDILYKEIEKKPSGNEGGNTNTTPPAVIDQYEVETVIDYKNIPYVEVVGTSINSNSIDLKFKVLDPNNLVNSTIKVKYLNLLSGASNIKEFNNISGVLDFIADGLQSESKYLVTIYTSYTRNNIAFNDYVMFQRTFTTGKLGIGLTKDYASSSALSFSLELDKESSVTGGELNIYDEDYNLVDSITFNNNSHLANYTFEDLDSNKKYTVKVENININGVNYPDGYAVLIQEQTLKHNPFVDEEIALQPTASVNKIDYYFGFDLNITSDSDNAITSVTYNIYDKETNTLVKSIAKEDTSSIKVQIDNDIKSHTTYYYNAVISLQDNEKVIEYTTLNSNDFNMGNKISPTLAFQNGEISANTASGLFIITDPDNTIDTTKTVYVEYSDSKGAINTKMLAFGDCPENLSQTTKCVPLAIYELNSEEVYTIRLIAYVDLNDEEITPEHVQVGAIKLTTEEADIVLTNMYATELNERTAIEQIFEININFSLDEDVPETIKDNMSSFDIVLYEGVDAVGRYLGTRQVGTETNIVTELFDGTKTFTLSDFGLKLEDLRTLHASDGGKISKEYTVKLTNGLSGSDYVEFKPNSLSFEINDTLLEIANGDARIDVSRIFNNSNLPEEISKYYTNTLEEGTIIGIKALPNFGNKTFVNKIKYKVTDVTTTGTRPFIELTENLNLSASTTIPSHNFMFADYPEFFTRGHVYTISYTIVLDLDKDGIDDLEYPFSSNDMTVPRPVVSSEIKAYKQQPNIVMFPWTSSSNSIIYKYKVHDIDNALVNIVYSVENKDMIPGGVTCESSVQNYTTMYQCMELDALNKGDIYNIHLQTRLIDRASENFSAVEGNTYSFDGLYLENDLNDITYDILKNENGKLQYNNLLTIKVYSSSYEALSYEEKATAVSLLDRISQYNMVITSGTKSFSISNINDSALSRVLNDPISLNQVKYTDTSTNTNKSVNMQKLAYVASCDENGGTCIFIDYSKLYNSPDFKAYFSTFKNQDISISLSAVYDTGKIGYLASTQNKYAFQVDTLEPKTNGGNYIDKYLILPRSLNSRATFKNSALSAIYKYDPLTSQMQGFVDDKAADNNTSTGKITFENIIYSTSSKVTYDYKVTAKGIEVNFNPNTGYLPIVAKELGNVSIAGEDNTFAYERVVPALSVLGNDSTINGIKLNMNITGITDEDIDLESEKRYLYVEVYNEADEKVQTVKINKDELVTQTGTAQKNNSIMVNGVINNNTYLLKAYDLSKVTITSIKVGGQNIAASGYTLNTSSGLITFASTYDDNTSVEVTYTTSNVTYIVKTDSNYYVDLNTVTVDGNTVTNYSYDYLTGVITFDDSSEGKEVNLLYKVVITDLDINTTYYLKAFMKMSGSDTYLIDTSSELYEDFKLSFTTKNTTDIAVSNSAFSYTSNNNYANRALKTDYKIVDIIGLEDLTYSICNDDSTSCVDITKYTTCSNSYNYFGGTCITKNGTYNMTITHDITNTADWKFLFNTNYNLFIKAKIRTVDGLLHDYNIYNKAINISGLDEPTINVGRNSHFKKDQSGNDNYYLSFDISFVDEDRVISAFDKPILDTNGNTVDTIHSNAGQYIVYLAEGSNRDVVQNVKDVNGNIIDTYQVFSTTDSNKADTTAEITFGYLNENSEYYLMVEYQTYRNNADLTEETKTKAYNIPYLIYTQNNYNISIGKTEFVPVCSTSKLRFAYATNLMPRYVYNPATGRNDLPDPEQEAYVTGIIYNVSRPSGDATPVVENTIIFTDANPTDIIYTQNINNATQLGDYYYEIAITGTKYPTSSVMYGINYKFYIGGNVMNDLNTKTLCEDASPTNYWDTSKNKCYKLEENWYNANAIFGGSVCAS